MSIQWSEEFSMNIAEIDEQHKELVNMINELDESVGKNRSSEVIGGILRRAIDYCGFHFGTEEKLMLEYGYPAYEEHKQEHDHFKKVTQDLYKSFEKKTAIITVETAVFLKGWLETHLLGTDKKYVEFFHEKGVH